MTPDLASPRQLKHTGASPVGAISQAVVLGTQPITIDYRFGREKEPAPLSLDTHTARLDPSESSKLEWDGTSEFANFSEGDGSVSDPMPGSMWELSGETRL